jgi:hypothetical protein
MDWKETDWENTETLRKIVQSDIYDLGERLIFVTNWLEKSGLSREAIMLGYFNACMRVTTESRGIMGSYIMANQLHWHIVQLIQKLYTASHAVHLDALPADPRVKTETPGEG